MERDEGQLSLGDILNDALREYQMNQTSQQASFDYWLNKPMITDIKEYREQRGCSLREAIDAIRRARLVMLITHAESPAEFRTVLYKMLTFIRN